MAANGLRTCRRCECPELVGERYGTAVKDLHKVGLVQHAPGFTGTIGNPGYNGNCKKILSQAPTAGTRLPKGGTGAVVYGVCPRAVANANPAPQARRGARIAAPDAA